MGNGSPSMYHASVRFPVTYVDDSEHTGQKRYATDHVRAELRLTALRNFTTCLRILLRWHAITTERVPHLVAWLAGRVTVMYAICLQFNVNHASVSTSTYLLLKRTPTLILHSDGS